MDTVWAGIFSLDLFLAGCYLLTVYNYFAIRKWNSLRKPSIQHETYGLSAPYAAEQTSTAKETAPMPIGKKRSFGVA